MTQYFLENRYFEDLNKENNLGTKGELAIAYGQIIKYLWNGNKISVIPTRFKKILGKHHDTFRIN